MASQLLKATEAILAANQIDMEAARGRSLRVILDRLFLDQERIEGMAQGIRALIDLPDPMGKCWILKFWKMALKSRRFESLWASLGSFAKTVQM